MSDWKRVGEIGVDAGLCWLGDPCYCVTPDASSHPAQTWTEFVSALYQPNQELVPEAGQPYTPIIKQFNYKAGHPGLGVCVETGWGDGGYPVYVKLDPATGRVAEVKVVFIGSGETDEDSWDDDDDWDDEDLDGWDDALDDWDDDDDMDNEDWA